MKKEVNPNTTNRAMAFELWMHVLMRRSCTVKISKI